MDVDPNEIDLDGDGAQLSSQMDEMSVSPPKVKEQKKKNAKRKIQFRNYIPKDEKLRKKYCVEPAKPVVIEGQFTELIEKAKALNHDIHDIAPKKSNWDIKRDCQPQLDQLEYLTQLAIRKIVEKRQAEASDEESDDEEDSDDGDESA